MSYLSALHEHRPRRRAHPPDPPLAGEADPWLDGGDQGEGGLRRYASGVLRAHQDEPGVQISEHRRWAAAIFEGRHRLYRPGDGGRAPIFQPSPPGRTRSEEHTSELQSLMRISYAVLCLKKKKQH